MNFTFFLRQHEEEFDAVCPCIIRRERLTESTPVSFHVISENVLGTEYLRSSPVIRSHTDGTCGRGPVLELRRVK